MMDWREAGSCLGRAGYFLFVAAVILCAIAALASLAGCTSDCSTGFKGPLYFHTHDGDMACR